MARLALSQNAQIDFSQPYWHSFAPRVIDAYFRGMQLTPSTLGDLPAGINNARQEATIIVHPLWDQEPANFRPELAAAVIAAAQAKLQVKMRSLFHVVRFPYE